MFDHARRAAAAAAAVVLAAALAGCSESSPGARPETVSTGVPPAMAQFRAADGLYAVPQLMSERPAADLADTAFWLAALAMTHSAAGRTVLPPAAAQELRPLVNAQPGIDALMLAALLAEHTGADLAAPATVEAVLRLQQPSGFFTPADAPAQPDLAGLVDFSYRAAVGLKDRRRGGAWLDRLSAAARTVTPSRLPTAYLRAQLTQLQTRFAAPPSTTAVEVAPPTSPAEREKLFDLLAQAELGGRIAPQAAARWVDWVAASRPSAADAYVVARALFLAHADRVELDRLGAVVERLSATAARPSGTFHAQYETAGDLKASYLFLVSAKLATGATWRDPALVAAVSRRPARPATDPFAQWERFLAARVEELAGDPQTGSALEAHPAWVTELSQNIRALPENVLVAVDAGVVVPELWKPTASASPGELAHLYVANWMARSATPPVAPALLASWRSALARPGPATTNREQLLVAAALLLADPSGDTSSVRERVQGLVRSSGNCAGVTHLVASSASDRSCDLQATLASSIVGLVQKGESVEQSLE